jgi:hypothetical protein
MSWFVRITRSFGVEFRPCRLSRPFTREWDKDLTSRRVFSEPAGASLRFEDQPGSCVRFASSPKDGLSSGGAGV